MALAKHARVTLARLQRLEPDSASNTTPVGPEAQARSLGSPVVPGGQHWAADEAESLGPSVGNNEYVQKNGNT
jgi:hypothetical protein